MTVVELKTNKDNRGSLTVIEGGQDIPFDIKRCYIIHHLEAARGGHAHPHTRQIVIAVHGSIRMELSDGVMRKSFDLNSPTQGLLINPMTWIEIVEFSQDAVVSVLASTHYDHKLTIRDWDQFTVLKNQM